MNSKGFHCIAFVFWCCKKAFVARAFVNLPEKFSLFSLVLLIRNFIHLSVFYVETPIIKAQIRRNSVRNHDNAGF